MYSEAIRGLAAGLRRGELPEAQPWDIAAAVRLIADELAGPGGAITVDEVRAAGKALNQQRHFEHTRMLGQAWTDTRDFDPTVARQHAQAEINLSALDAAEQRLRRGLAQLRGSAAGAGSHEISEYEGLLGRTHKQRYVATADRDRLVQATDQYLAHYEANPARPFWHGINVAALLAREGREGLPARPDHSSEKLAAAVYAQVTALFRKGGADQWVPATASEASLALDLCDEAELWLYRFLHHPKVQPFDVESYGRQIREIWQGSATAGSGSCADRLAAIMERHVARTERRFAVTPSAVPAMTEALRRDPGAFEKNFSGEGTFSLDALRRMLESCASIGCVSNTRGERLGTGFLISGGALKDAFGPGPVFVTNAHVISETVPNAIRRQDVRVSFEVECGAGSDPRLYRVSEELFTSEPGALGHRIAGDDKLDVTIVRLEGVTDRAQKLELAKALPLIEPRSKAFVVGHPRGSGLQISLHDSVLLDIDDDGRLLHYRTPTDPGSSGSPVFNMSWEVVAVHHGGSRSTPRLRGPGIYEANEGIALSAVRRKLNP